MTQPAQRPASTGTGETTNPPAEAQTSPPVGETPAQQSGQAQPRDPNESVYTREDIMDFANSAGYGLAKPEALMGVLRWREQETGQPVTEFTKSDLEAWLPEFLGREV